MLVFEMTNGHTKLGIMGNIEDITCELLICIGLVHNSLKGKNAEAAKQLRRAIEEFCSQGTDANNMLFEHFGDSGWLKAMEKKRTEKSDGAKQRVLDSLQELIDKIKGLDDD